MNDLEATTAHNARGSDLSGTFCRFAGTGLDTLGYGLRGARNVLDVVNWIPGVSWAIHGAGAAVGGLEEARTGITEKLNKGEMPDINAASRAFAESAFDRAVDIIPFTDIDAKIAAPIKQALIPGPGK